MKNKFAILLFLLSQLFFLRTNAQNVVWMNHINSGDVINHTMLYDTLFVSGTYDTCIRKFPVLWAFNSLDGVPLSRQQYGFPVCVNQGTGAAWSMPIHNDTLYYSLTAPDSSFPNVNLVLFGTSSSPFDTIPNCLKPIYGITESIGHSRVVNEGDVIRSISATGSTIDSVAILGTSWMRVVSDESSSSLYAFNSSNAAFGSDKLIGVALDSTFTISAGDTINPRNGPERITNVTLCQQFNACIVTTSNTVNFDPMLHRFDFMGNFTHQRSFANGNNILNDVLLSYDGLSLFALVQHIQLGVVCIYKMSPADLTVLDSTIINANVNYPCAMALSDDGYIYLINKANQSTFRIIKLEANLTNIGYTDIPDSLGIYVSDFRITAASGGLVWISARAGVVNRSLVFHVNMNNVGYNDHFADCNLSNSVASIDFWSNLTAGCIPKEISIYNLMGQQLYSKQYPQEWDYLPTTSGLYIAVISWENGNISTQGITLLTNH